MSRLPAVAAPGDTVRRRLIRDAVVFQVKLILDGVLDVFLGPVSLICAVLELARGARSDGSLFYDFLRYGRRAEQWIDRFGAVDDPPRTPPRP